MAKHKAEKPSIFDDSDDDTNGGVELKVNSEYARRFEHNKKREEQHRLEEKQKAGKSNGTNNNNDDDSEDDSSEDETEDEDGFLATAELDAQLNATLEAIRKKDPRVYDKDATFYSPIDDPAAAAPSAVAKQKKEKPVTIQDYHRKRILEGDTGKDFDEEDDGAPPPKSYVQEQADIKQSIRDEIAKHNDDDSDSDDDDFIKAKSKPTRVVAEADTPAAATDIHPSRAGRVKTPAVAKPDIAIADKDPELFLSNFMASRAWVEDEGPKWEAFESDDGDDAGNEKADAWEEAYNLRFEDPSKSNEVLKTYARDVTAARSVRREEKSSRKRQREEEAERKALEKQQRKEERARLRRLKIDEAEAKLNKIRKAAGLSGNALRDEDWQKLLDAGFDNDKWEEEMAKHFNDQYYAQADEEMGGAESGAESDADEKAASAKKSKKPKKPTWDDDIDIKDLVPDFDDEEGGAGVDDEAEEDEEDAEDGPAAKRQKTTKDRKKERLQSQKEARRERAKLEAIVDAHMNIEDPEILGANQGNDKNNNNTASSSNSAGPSSQPGGFRYRETKPESFGLTTLDILMASDSALNQYAGLKKLAHFRPEDKQAKDKKRLGKKARLRQWRKDTFGPEFEREPPAYNPGRPEPVEEDGTAGGAAESNIIEGGSKKKRKRNKVKKAEAAA